MAKFPDDLRYTKQHEWVRLSGKHAFVGVTEYAAEQLGDVVHVDLPELDAEFEKDAVCASIESVKSVSDVYLPVSGKVVEVNEVITDNAAIVNEDPYGEGWMVKVTLTDVGEVGGLMTAAQYREFVAQEKA